MSGRAKLLVTAVVVVLIPVGLVIEAVNGPETAAPAQTAATAPVASGWAPTADGCEPLVWGWGQLQDAMSQGDTTGFQQLLPSYLSVLSQYSRPSAGQDQTDLQSTAGLMYGDLTQMAADLKTGQPAATNDFIDAAGEYQTVDYICTGE